MKACMPAFLAVLISASEQPLAQSLQLSQVKAGKLRALAVTGKTRVAAAPDVPTLAESGLSNYEFISWMGVAAPCRHAAADHRAPQCGACTRAQDARGVGVVRRSRRRRGR